MFGGIMANEAADPSATLNGVAHESVFTLDKGTGFLYPVGYFVFPASAYPASSDLIVTFPNGSYFDIGVSAYGFDSTKSPTNLTSVVDAAASPIDLSGTVLAGDDVLVSAYANNGVTASLTGVTENYNEDIRGDDIFVSGLATNVAGGARTITADSSVSSDHYTGLSIIMR
jgi:hypothetical protein